MMMPIRVEEEAEVEEMVTKFQRRVTISAEEEELKVAAEEYENVIMAKLMTDRSFNKSSFVKTMSKAWKVKDEDVKELADSVFMVKTGGAIQRDRILEGGPWNFMNQVVITKRWEAGTTPHEYLFDRCCFWVQIHNLPAEYLEGRLARAMAAKCAKAIKNLKHFPETEMRKNKFLRMKVEINIKNALCPGVELEREGRSPLWLAFKFERLPMLCYGCGRIGHMVNFCPNDKGQKGGDEEFGPWLRAENEELARDGSPVRGDRRGRAVGGEGMQGRKELLLESSDTLGSGSGGDMDKDESLSNDLGKRNGSLEDGKEEAASNNDGEENEAVRMLKSLRQKEERENKGKEVEKEIGPRWTGLEGESGCDGPTRGGAELLASPR